MTKNWDVDCWICRSPDAHYLDVCGFGWCLDCFNINTELAVTCFSARESVDSE